MISLPGRDDQPPPSGFLILHSDNSRLVKAVTDAAAGHMHVRHMEKTKPFDLPRRADYVVTSAALSSTFERFAAGFGAMPLILPEASDYLSERLHFRTEQGRGAVIVGSDHMVKR